MTSTTTWTWMCSAALALTFGLTGCDDEAAGSDDEVAAGDGPVAPRGGGDGTWGPGKLNTNFLGEDSTYPLTSIPLVDDPAAPIRLHAVWARRCVDREKGILYKDKLFFTSDLVGDLGVTVEDGELRPATFKLLSDPSVTCQVSGNDWVGTVWGVIVREGDVETNHYMMITDARLDERGNRVYRWGVLTGPDPFEIKYYKPTCAEDEDPFGADTLLLRYHSYLISGLHVDEASGDFTEVADTLYVACRSGAIGKAIDWGYAPWDVGTDVHELATRVVRADYCGDGGTFTAPGNVLQLRDELGVSDFYAVTWDREAAWDLATSRATCVSTPRDHLQRQNTPIVCGGQVMPACSEQAMTSSIFATRIAD